MATEPCPGDNAKYTITLNAAQARAVLSGLELYFRLGMGQFEEIKPLWNGRIGYSHELANMLVDDLRRTFTALPPNQYLGIDSLQLPEHFKVACDVFQVLRREVAREEQHHAASVWHHAPLRHSQQPLPKVHTENQP